MQQEFDLVKQLKILWRFAWIIALVAVIAGATAWKFSSSGPAMYEAKATVMVESAAPKGLTLPAGLEAALGIALQSDMKGQIEAMKSRSVLERAITQLEPEKALDPAYLQLESQKLWSSLSTQQGSSANLVTLSVVSPDPMKAQRQVNAVANAYVYEAGRSRLATLETALDNTTKRLKEIRTSKVDISGSPSFTMVTAQVNTALASLRTASDHLQKVQAGTDAGPSGGTASKDTGTTLTALQLSLIVQRMGMATTEAKDLSALAQRLQWQPTLEGYEAHSTNLAAMESQTRALNIKLQTMSAEMELTQRTEIAPDVQGALLMAREPLQVAASTTAAILQQVAALYTVDQQLRVATASAGAIIDQLAALYGVSDQLRASSVTATAIPVQAVALQKEAFQDLLRRITQHANLAATTMETVSAQLQTIKTREAAVKSQDVELRNNTLRQRLSASAISAISALEALSNQLQPPASNGGVLMTDADVATMAIRAQTITTTLSFLLTELNATLPNERDAQVYAELLSAAESMQLAGAAANGLPDQMANLAKSAGDGLSYVTLDNLRQQLQITQLTTGAGGTKVMDTAMVAAPIATSFGRLRNALLAVVAVLLLVVLGILVLQNTDRRVRDASQVKSYVGLPQLASLTRIMDTGDHHPPSVLNGAPPSYLESFRMLRTNLGLDSRQGHVLMVSSPGEKEGKTTVAANLARVVALQGRKVLLVDGNLRKPDIGAAFGMAKRDGLSAFLTSENELERCVTRVDGIDILAVAAASARSAEELSSPRMKVLLEKARQVYDVVIVDSGPANAYADARILAKLVDEVVLVLQANASTLDLAKDNKLALEAAGARVTGFVLNKVETNGASSSPVTIIRNVVHKQRQTPTDRISS